MNRNVWIFCHHTSPPEFGHFTRHYSLSKELIKNGYSPVVFMGSVPHNSNDQLIKGKESFSEYNEHEFPYIFIKTCIYNKNVKKRLIAMLQYYFRLFKVSKGLLKKGYNKPDIIIGSSVHPLACVAAIQIAKKFKIPCIVEIKDLWPESIVLFSSRLTKKNPIIKILYKLEKWIYKKADKIIFTMEGGSDYIKEQGWDSDIDMNKVYHINNGVDLDDFDYNISHYKLEDDDLNNEKIFKVVYTGSIRRVNNIGLILDVAKQINNDKIKILIWGDGDEVEILKQRILDERIQNVCLKGHVEKKYIPFILSKSDLNILHYEYTDIFKYGTSQNKNFEYLASATPVLNTININYDIVEKKSAGITLKSQTTGNIANAILQFANLEQVKLEKMGQNGRKLAEEYDFKNLTKKLIFVIES